MVASLILFWMPLTLAPYQTVDIKTVKLGTAITGPMKVITLRQLENDFDAIMDDISENKAFYKLQTENGAFMLVPYEEYSVLADTYQEWVEEPTINPFPLPVEYVGEAQPEDFNQKSQAAVSATDPEDYLDKDN